MSRVNATLREGQLVWVPSAERVERAQITRFLRWLASERRQEFANYRALWEWSIAEMDAFWMSLWDYFEIISDVRPRCAIAGGVMFKARWFEGSRLNFAEHLLRHEIIAVPGETALCHASEIRPLGNTSWQEFGSRVRKLATRLRQMGVVPGDRVVAYMPNLPETVVAMAAATAIGAIWSSAAPEFGSKTVIDRFSQIAPKLAFVADGYSFNGRVFDRRPEIARIAAALPTLEHIVWLDYIGLEPLAALDVPSTAYQALFDGPDVPREGFIFERVPPDHPLWILYSSGTTGLPKAIVHGHAGMTLTLLKDMALNLDLGPSKRMFFYTTTGWMMWNAVVSSLLTGASAVLYDGSPVHGGTDALWKIAADTKTTLFGASPTLVKSMEKAGVRPGETFDISTMESIALGGAPATPEIFRWIYDAISPDIWIANQSGGTDMCSAIAGGVVTQAVHAGELQAPLLGIDLQVWNDGGVPLHGKVGELVIAKPFPAAPLYFWGDADDRRYFSTYFETYSNAWRHGDLARTNEHGGFHIYGRSDATLNRFGVRIGTAEIYGVLEDVQCVRDSLVVCVDRFDGSQRMTLFVELVENANLTEALMDELRRALREQASPRHVPDEIVVAPGIPYTLTGKKMEIPVGKLLAGIAPDQAASKEMMARPELLEWFAGFARRHRESPATPQAGSYHSSS